jgi:hypothetical protein
MILVLHLIAWQAAWFTTVLGAAHGMVWLGPVSLLPVLALAWRGGNARAWIYAAVLGLVVDGGLVAAGAFRPAEPLGPVTLWMPCLWIALASALGLSLRWMVALRPGLRLVVAASFGAIGGAGAYAGGFAFGALTPGDLERTPALLAIAGAWALAMPVLLDIHRLSAPRPA